MRLRIEELRIFALYKDRAHKGVRNIKNIVKREQGFEPSGDFCREIINYQVKTYGKALDSRSYSYVPDFYRKTKHYRRYHTEKSNEEYKTKRLIERNTKRGKKDL
jgi:hypothetical protein